MNLDVPPTNLVGKIGARPDRVGKGKIRDCGCRKGVSGVVRRGGRFRKIGEEISGDFAETGSFRRGEEFGGSDSGR